MCITIVGDNVDSNWYYKVANIQATLWTEYGWISALAITIDSEYTSRGLCL